MPKLSLVLLAAALIAGCKKDEKGAGTGSGAPAAVPQASHVSHAQQVSSALEKTGLKPSAPFEQAAARPYEARTCARGEIDRLDVLVCDYDGEPKASKGEQLMEQFASGAVSGAVRRSGSRVLAVADRSKVDLHGEGINRVLKAFAGGK